MIYFYRYRFLAFLLVFSFSYARDGPHEKMYNDLNINSACFRRLNGTHQFGCSSSKSGNVGIIHLIKNETDFNIFVNKASTERYVIALYMNMFTRAVVDKILKLNNIEGLLLVVQKSFTPDNYSPDGVCPNSKMNSCEGEINPYGNDFLFIDWPFPMFMVDDDAIINIIEKCYHDFNLPFDGDQSSVAFYRPLCSIQMRSHMSAAVNTPTCLRRESEAGARVYKYCDPMGDRNIIFPIIGDQNTFARKSVVVIAARLDTATIFDGVSSGAITAGTSVVTLIATANVLNKLIKSFDVKNKEVVFMFFNGEAQDYIGSSRIIYDMKTDNFFDATALNFTLDNIKAFIEVSQIDYSTNFFLHSTKDDTIRDFENKLASVSKNYSLKFFQSKLPYIPPSSLQMFLKNDPSIPGVVISNYDDHYTNKYYNGFLDNSKMLNYTHGHPLLSGSLQKNVAELSMTLASAVFSSLTGFYTPIKLEDVGQLVDDLLQCYIETRFCRLMKEVSSGSEGSGQNVPWPMYVSVQPSLNPVTTATGLLLAYLTSEPVALNKDNCATDSKSFSYYWVNGPNSTGICLNTTMKFTQAVSPAFLIENYDWTSGNYSTWTESIWFDFGVSMFLKPSRRKEWIAFGIGVFVCAVSFLSVYLLNKKAKDLFNPSRVDCSLLTTNC